MFYFPIFIIVSIFSFSVAVYFYVLNERRWTTDSNLTLASISNPSLFFYSGLDLQHATVTVIDEDINTSNDEIKYDDVVQHLKQTSHHMSNISMDTHPQIPITSLDQSLTMVVKEDDHLLSIAENDIHDIQSQASCFADDTSSVIRKLSEEEEGMEDIQHSTDFSSMIIHPPEEKFAELVSSEYDGNETGNEHSMTLGGHMLNALESWQENEYLPQELDESFGERLFPRFPISPTINRIIRIWDGDPIVKCDAMVIPITENWTAVSQSSHAVMNIAGSEYLEYIYLLKKMNDYVCTGDVKNIPSFDLPCKHIIHTAPPTYNDRYPVASENAMNSCYWRSLELANDLKCKSIVFLPICPPNFYSQHLSIHILSRTLRRFLERAPNSSLKSVVICIEQHDHLELYMRIITVYFPRDYIDLKYSHKYLPAYTGIICVVNFYVLFFSCSHFFIFSKISIFFFIFSFFLFSKFFIFSCSHFFFFFKFFKK